MVDYAQGRNKNMRVVYLWVALNNERCKYNGLISNGNVFTVDAFFIFFSYTNGE